MSWNYQARKVVHKIKHGDHEYTETQYELVEYFTKTKSWTTEPISLASDTKEGLAKLLRKAADDVEKYGVIEE